MSIIESQKHVENLVEGIKIGEEADSGVKMVKNIDAMFLKYVQNR